MHSFARGLLLLVLAISVAPQARASSMPQSLVNWTETWIEIDAGGFVISGFEYDDTSVFDLVDFDPVVQTDFVSFGLSGSEFLVGAIVEVTIPNFFDPLPRKLVDIVFEGANGNAAGLELPRVLDIIGADAPFSPPPGPAVNGAGAERVSTKA